MKCFNPEKKDFQYFEKHLFRDEKNFREFGRLS
jgi:hypothetical protein